MNERVKIFESKEQAERAIPLNQIRKIRIEKLEICLANTSQGFVAFEKDCPHMSDDLSKGNINNLMEVACPWHAYRFSLISGEETEQRCKNLIIYDLEWLNEMLYITIQL